MCLAIPGKVIEINDSTGILMGKIAYGEVVNDACLAYVPEIKVGQYAIVHAGFAISVVDEEEAQKSFDIWKELQQIAADEDFTPEQYRPPDPDSL